MKNQNLPWLIYLFGNEEWHFHSGFTQRSSAEHCMRFIAKHVPDVQLKLVFNQPAR
ncbi:MAG: hypothetical protein QNJ51_27520 [Calothrix sp. MO_167.B12]|nr:hypothetical protein [Calothrix sp. MO_167.B12]